VLVDDFLYLAVEQFDVAVDRRSAVEVVQRRPLNVAVERRPVDPTYVTVAVARDGRQVAWHVQTTGDEMMVAEACWTHDHLRQRVVVACRHYQQVQSVVAARCFGDVLRQVVSQQQVPQADAKMAVSGSRTVEVAAYDEPLLGGDKLVQHVCKLLTEQL